MGSESEQISLKNRFYKVMVLIRILYECAAVFLVILIIFITIENRFNPAIPCQSYQPHLAINKVLDFLCMQIHCFRKVTGCKNRIHQKFKKPIF